MTTNFALPQIGLGTWRYGEDPQMNEADFRAVIYAIERGITHIDTAELYGGGKTERFLNQVFSRVERHSLFIASKASVAHAQPDQVIFACHASLNRMGLDYLDLYMPHERNAAVPLDETMAAFNQLVDDRLVRHIGVSNFGLQSLVDAQSVSAHKIIANQAHYNLAVRDVESTGLLDHCQRNAVSLVAWRPVKKSFAQDGTIVDSSDDPILSSLCQKYGKTALQVSLNWLVSQRNVCTLIKSSEIKHIDQNLGALGWSLSNDDIELLRANYVPQDVPPDMPLL